MAKNLYCCKGYFMCPLHEDETHDFMTDSLLVTYGIPVCGRCYQDMEYHHCSNCQRVKGGENEKPNVS